MAFNRFLSFPNKLSPQFAPAEAGTVLSDYFDLNTGAPRYYNAFQYNSPLPAYQYVYYMGIPKGNQELRAMWLTMTTPVRFNAPSGGWIEFRKYSDYIQIYANDGNGEDLVGAYYVNISGRNFYVGFLIDIEREYVRPWFYSDNNGDTTNGLAWMSDDGANVGTWSNGKARKLWNIVHDIEVQPDPYKPGGTSTTGGGNGDQTFLSDAIGEPSAPTLSPQGSRLLTLYKVDSTILKDFANYLWAGGIDFATLHNIFNDTMGAVISLAVCPFTPSGNTPQNLWFGNFDSGVSATLIDSQYATVDCGTLSLDEEYKSALDYNPYCKIELCLPYCGNVSLDPDEFMGTDISIKYKIDLLTGACIACVFSDGNLLLTVPGNVLASVPVTNADHKAIVSSVAGTAISVAGAALAVATGGMTAPAAATTAATVSAANTLNMKERYSHGGTGNANTALLGPQKPYLIIKWPRQCLPENNNKYQGYPSMITEALGDLYGFTQVHKIHLDGISATQNEIMELEAALMEGVIL